MVAFWAGWAPEAVWTPCIGNANTWRYRESNPRCQSVTDLSVTVALSGWPSPDGIPEFCQQAAAEVELTEPHTVSRAGTMAHGGGELGRV
jgi:hypothetical protein